MITIASEQDMLNFGCQLAKELLSRLGPSEASSSDTTPSSTTSPTTPSGLVLELVGDVGTGKTTITRGLAMGLGITEPVTSPSFTISKQYAFTSPQSNTPSRHDPPRLHPDHTTDQSINSPTTSLLVHYDFYRLPDPGLMVEDLAESIANPHAITVVEWAESVAEILPKDRCIFYITINDDNSRTISPKSPLAQELLSVLDKQSYHSEVSFSDQPNKDYL